MTPPPVIGRAEIPTSRLVDCYVERRAGDSGPLFFELVGFGVMAHLDHYAIVPVDSYRKLCEAAGVDPSALARLPVRS